MLSRLSIRDIVLIDKLDIDFAEGLAVLTGETGAGKSILLDAFAHHAGVAAAAERELQRVDQDRFAGPGLAGQHRQPLIEREIEPLDQHNVADG